MDIWLAVVLGSILLVLLGAKGFVWCMNQSYLQGMERGMKLERELVLRCITSAPWRFKRENTVHPFGALVSMVGEIPLTESVDLKNGERVRLQKRLAHQAGCPFSFFGYERDLSLAVNRPPEEAHNDA